MGRSGWPEAAIRLAQVLCSACVATCLLPACWVGGWPGLHGPRLALEAVPRLKVVVPKRKAKAAWSISRLQELCEEQGASKVLSSKGVSVVSGAFQAEELEALLKAFTRLERRRMLHSMRFGELRGERSAVHLPFEEPFSRLPLLGREDALRDILTENLGENFELESAMIIKVDAGANAQNAHMDMEDKGSVSVHLPLQPLHKGFAPLSLLVGSHEEPSLLAEAAPKMNLFRKEQLLARRRQRTATAKEEHFLRWGDADVRLLPDVDLRRGQGRCLVRGIRGDAATLGLQPGDEVTHVNELDFISWLQVKDFVPELREELQVRVLRPIEEDQELPEEQADTVQVPRQQLRVWMSGRHEEKLLIAAPLQVGDALIYDSRTVHWGSANRDEESRYALYLNFKKSDFQGTSPDEMAIEGAQRRCRVARERFREKLLRELHYLEDT